ncbi:MAG: hypothetical protein IE909_11680 [Campylobacterales bacterium]|nr:hypothetical protein [Campylobacterales bacterium]
MASDLSSIIQESLPKTLTDLLGKDVALKGTNKAHQKDLPLTQLLKIETTFEFDNITSTWEFIFPAITASTIYNSFIADESEPSSIIDDEITDGLSEFVSNVSGTLTTSFNGSELEDLGKSKFTIGTKQIIDSASLINLEDLYKFILDLEGVPLTIFIQFDQVINPFIEILSKSPQSVFKDEPFAQKNEPEEEISSAKNSTEQLTANDDTSTKSEQETFKEQEFAKPTVANESIKAEDETEKTTQEELTPEAKKEKKLKLVIYIVAGLLILTIISGVVLYFMGAFDPVVAASENNETNTTQTTAKNGSKKSRFDTKVINVDSLNNKLQLIAQSDEPITPNNTKMEKPQNFIEELEAFAQNNKEEPFVVAEKNLSAPTSTKVTSDLPKEPIVQNATTTDTNIEQNLVVNTSLYLKTFSLEYNLFKNTIQQAQVKTARILLCQDIDKRSFILMGPFENGFEYTKFPAFTKANIEPLQLQVNQASSLCKGQ